MSEDIKATASTSAKKAEPDAVEKLDAERNALMKKRALDARQQQIKDQKDRRAAQKALDNAESIVELKHGSYIDNKNYTHDDADRPPAVPGDFLTVTAREAKRLVKEGVAELVAS